MPAGAGSESPTGVRTYQKRGRRLAVVRLTVLGSSGAFPTAECPSNGFLVEHEGFHLLLDVGYATFPALLWHLPVERLDAVYITHGHPDHCADLNPLLRARARVDGGRPAPPLRVFAPPGALDAVLALDRPGMLDDALKLSEFTPGDSWRIGPFAVRTGLLPHFWPNAAVRLDAAGRALAYSGDGGPSEMLETLARDADLLIAEASYVDEVPDDLCGQLSSARDAGNVASAAGVGSLLLAHLMPGISHAAASAAAGAVYRGSIEIATPNLVREL